MNMKRPLQIRTVEDGPDVAERVLRKPQSAAMPINLHRVNNEEEDPRRLVPNPTPSPAPIGNKHEPALSLLL